MLEKIANRRISNVEDGEKIVVQTQLFNNLTSLAKYSAEGFLNRRKKQQTDCNIGVKIFSSPALREKRETKVLANGTKRKRRKHITTFLLDYEEYLS